MQLRFKVFTVLAVLLVSVLLTTQVVLAQADDPSRNRALGIGLLAPTVFQNWPGNPLLLSLRLWLGDILGLEALLWARPSDVEFTSSLGGSVLLKMINTSIFDFYAAVRVIATRLFSITLTTIQGATGLELSLGRFVAISLEAVFFRGGFVSISSLGQSSAGAMEFIFGFSGGVHVYF